MDLSHSELSQAVFKINTGSGSGSGFYLKDQNIVVTNHHVAQGYTKVSLENEKKDRFLARVIMLNPVTDIAFLQPDADFTGLPQLNTGDLTPPQSRDQVFVLGYPFGMPFTVTEGIVSNPQQLLEGRHYIQTDAAVNPGNSGGPVVAADGDVLGITTSKFTQADNVGFAIPVSVLREELKSLDQNPERVFSVKCSSCDTLQFQPVDYCSNCGNSIDKKLFNETPLSNFGQFIEQALGGLGIDPVLTRSGYEFWEFYHGTALIRVFVYNQNYLYATSPLNMLPKANLEKLYTYMLSNPVAPYTLGIYENQIFLSFRRYITDINSIHADEIKGHLVNLVKKADEMDDFFTNEFGAEKTNYAKGM